MAKITRIKASDPGKTPEPDDSKTVAKTKVKAGKSKAADAASEAREVSESKETPEFSEREARAHKKLAEDERRAMKKAEKRKAKLEDQDAQGGPKLKRVLTAPFRYLRDSWREIRQVRWPNRKATWKMVLAIFLYAAFFVALIMLLDVFFTWLFNLILK